MHFPLPRQREIGARLALRDDMDPGLKPLSSVLEGGVLAAASWSSSPTAALFCICCGNKPDGLRGRIFARSNISTKLTGRLNARILAEFPRKFSGHFGRHLDVGGADP